MKTRAFDLNCLGFSNSKKLKLSDKLIAGGVTVIGIGLILVVAGQLTSIKHSIWAKAGNKEVADQYYELYKEHEASWI